MFWVSLELNMCWTPVFKVYKILSSFQARDRKMVGDMDGARSYGSTACNLNIIATIIVTTAILIFIITFSVITAKAASYYSHINSYNFNRNYRY